LLVKGATIQPVEDNAYIKVDWKRALNAMWKRSRVTKMYKTSIKTDVECSQDLDLKTKVSFVVEKQR